MLLTYDDVRVAGVTPVICCEVPLDLVSSLIEQIQVIFYRIWIVDTLTETDDPCQREADAH